MAAALFEKLVRHRANIIHVVWAPAVAIFAMAAVSRVLTEVAPASTFGEAKLAQGGVALAIALVGRPAVQFVMREFHDARQSGRERAFEQFARQRQLRIALGLGVPTVSGLLLASVFGLGIPPLACMAAGLMLVVEVLLSTELALALTRNEQRLVSVAEVVRQGGLSFVAAAAIYFVADSSAAFLAAQALFALACLLVVRRVLGANEGVDPPTEEEASGWQVAGRRFVVPMLASGLFNWALNMGDRYVMAHYCTEAEVGRYSAIYGMIALPIGAAGGILARFLFPLVFGAAARKDDAAQRYMLRGMLILCSAIGAASVAGAVLLGPWVLKLALAREYREGSEPLLAWLAAGQACLITSFSLDMKAYARKLTLVFSLAAGAAALVNIGLNFAWIPTLGALGAARATFFGYLVYLLVSTIILRNPERWDRTVQSG